MNNKNISPVNGSITITKIRYIVITTLIRLKNLNEERFLNKLIGKTIKV